MMAQWHWSYQMALQQISERRPGEILIFSVLSADALFQSPLLSITMMVVERRLQHMPCGILLRNTDRISLMTKVST
jgi:hypothetical protein